MSNNLKISYIEYSPATNSLDIFMCGCTAPHCKGCYNEELWDFNAEGISSDECWQEIVNLNHRFDSLVDRILILGGEPFHNYDAVIKLIKKVKEIYPNKDIWIWTGYKFDDIPEKCKDILDLADVIVDGRYEEDKRDLSIAFRGSTNQRIWRKSTNEFNDTIWRYDRE